jgi:ABC-2 type transport system permease protein
VNLSRTLAIKVRLLRQFRRDRRTLALLFVAPIVILSLVGYLMRNQSQSVSNAVVNVDGGPLATSISNRLVSGPGSFRSISPADAEASLRAGDIDAYVLLPEGLEANLAQGRVVIELHREGTQPGSGQVAGAALQRALEAELAAHTGGLGVPPAPALEIRSTYLHGGSGLDQLDYFGAAFIGFVVFFLVFIVTSISFLRERSQGTLERLMALPLRRPEIVGGYVLGLTLVALVQGALVLAFSLLVLRVYNAGNPLLVFLLEALLSLAAVNLGIFLSMFARTEFQAIQFIPLVIVPQVLLSGILFPVSSEPQLLRYVSDALPLTYAVDGLREVMIRGAGLGSPTFLRDAAVMLGFALLMVAAASLSLRRRLD